jgi:3-oxoacyl-[acyl-carrier-protein] synthase-3
MGVHISGVGAYLPPHTVTNDTLSTIVDTSHEWIVTRTGIEKRHISTGDTIADMAEYAARLAIEDAGVAPAEIDLVIVATASPDHLFPSAACQLLTRLGIGEVMAFDLYAACTGVLYAINAARSMIESGSHTKALIVGSEALSRITDWTDRSTCVLFGDGAGALILEKSEEEGVRACFSAARSDISDAIYCRSHPIQNPWCEDKDERPMLIQMNGKEVFKFATFAMVDGVEKAAEMAGRSLEDIDWVVPHQANIRIIQYAANKLDIDDDKFFINIDHTANTGAASIPVALWEMKQADLLKPGDEIVLVAFGAGFTWGSVWLKWSD